jgi:hypothetical protein
MLQNDVKHHKLPTRKIHPTETKFLHEHFNTDADSTPAHSPEPPQALGSGPPVRLRSL